MTNGVKLVVGMTLAIVVMSAAPLVATDYSKLKTNLAYLKQIPEVAWVHFERNNVYIGWKSRPSDLRLVVNAAASSGNNAINFGVHVYNYMASRFPSPTTGPQFFCTATARHRKIEKSDC